MRYIPLIELQRTNAGWHFTLSAMDESSAARVIMDSEPPQATASGAARKAEAAWYDLPIETIAQAFAR